MATPNPPRDSRNDEARAVLMTALVNVLSFLVVADVIHLTIDAFASLQIAANSVIIAAFYFFPRRP